jgi:hypothetical protein
MDIGKDEKWILEQARKMRQPIPARFLTAPELYAGLGLYHMAFMDLTTCRQISQGVMGPISWQSIQNYCNEYDIHGEQREDMFYFVQKLDEAYLNWSHDKAAQEATARRAAQKAKQTGGG